MTDAGYAVFAIDRLGYGGSPRLTPQLLTLEVHAEVAHELIGKLRAGEVGGEAFDHVILVGHSYGTATAWRESAKYNDADAIIGTGWSNSVTPVPTARFLATYYPAQLDPKFAAMHLPPGYLTMRPGARGGDYFYAPGGFDPEVVDYDQNELRDTAPDGEGTFAARFGAIPLAPSPGSHEDIEVPLSSQTKQITIPTFQVLGSKELQFCGTDQNRCTSSQRLQRDESRFFSERACLRSAVTPNSGHIHNFHRNAQYTYASIRTFADDVLGPDGGNKDSYREHCASFSGANVGEAQPRFGP
jgi:pimeloyl-ACP methyl ester carboxylesterase